MTYDKTYTGYVMPAWRGTIADPWSDDGWDTDTDDVQNSLGLFERWCAAHLGRRNGYGVVTGKDILILLMRSDGTPLIQGDMYATT
jgi:hypothetical protein